MNADDPHILVVDDDTRLRSLLRKFLFDNGFLVATATDATDAKAKLATLHFDLIVMDVMMPGQNGIELTAELRRRLRTPILLLTAMGDVDDRIAGLESGADDYLAKPFEPRELLLRINNILRRTTLVSEGEPLSLGDYTFDPARGELTRGHERIHLTQGETSLLSVLSRAPGETLTREELQLRAKLSGNMRTVDVQVTRLRRKIEPDPRQPRYLITLRGEGYVLRPDRR